MITYHWLWIDLLQLEVVCCRVSSMQGTGVWLGIGIVIIIVIVGLVLFRSTGDEELAPGEESVLDLQDVSLPAADAPAGVQFDQPPVDLPDATSREQADDGLLDSVNGSPAEKAASEEVMISMSEVGFNPSTVTIPAGTTVTFVNDGQGPHWPASAVHPTHQVLPGFDARRGLATGETYSYTFGQPGTWSMHDHLNPSTTGQIIVQ
jgi:plastocyanin